MQLSQVSDQQAQDVNRKIPSSQSTVAPLPLCDVPLPPQIKLQNNEDCYVQQVITHIGEAINHFCQLDGRLSNVSDIYQKWDLLEQSKSRLSRECAELRMEYQLLGQLVNEPSIINNHDLTNYFVLCMSVIDNALKWESELEADILSKLEISTENSATKDADMQTKVKDYEEQAQQLIMQCVSVTGSTTSDNSQIKARIINLQKQIQKDYQKCKADSTMESFANKLKDILEFINNNFSSQTSLGDQVESLEGQLYMLIDEINQFTQNTYNTNSNSNNNSNNVSHTDIQSKIHKLIKEFATLRSQLTKQQQSSSPPSLTSSSSESLQYLIDRVEDMQANIADLEYNFTSKFQGAQTNQKWVDEHTKIGDSMFEL